MTRVHPSALVDAGAQLAEGVEVGPYAVIGPQVRVGARTRIGAHVVVHCNTTIGADNRIFPFSSIGADPQDKKYAGEQTWLEIGDGNTIRECVTLNRGTVQDRTVTRIGDDNWIMAYVHVAHDCTIGSHTIFANSTNLGGHVEVGDWAFLGGASQVHQFCKIGVHAMTATGTIVLHDVPPYVTVSGNTAAAHGINAEGLRRRGFSPERIEAIRRAYRTLYRSGLTLQQAIDALRQRQAELARDAGAGEAAALDLALLAGFLERVARGIVR